MEHNNAGCIEQNGQVRHEYNVKTCPNCRANFCYTCCSGTNVDQGGKYEPDYMYCPVCVHDYYKK